jgi:glutamine amidotransferase
VIALVDYGAGNLTSVRKALAALNAEFATPRTPANLHPARGIIVPGVGHFGATCAIDTAWRDAIRAAVDRGAALFGICLGMQWLFEGSAEAPDVPGYGAFRGMCTHLAAAPTFARDAGLTRATAGKPAALAAPVAPALKIPHVGWNSLSLPRPSTLMHGVPEDAQVYFTHSYVAPVVAETAAVTIYGATFSSAVERDRIAGVQFHPEKSGEIGLRILRNWLDAL